MPDKVQIIAEPLAKKTPLMGSGYLEDGHFYQYLFNGDNTERYLENAYEAIVKIKRILRQTNKPFSGVLPKELSPLFSSVNLDNPLDSWDLALEELEHLYIKDAVYFHHPKYVAHLNCPLVLPAVIAETIIGAINSSVDTWDQSAGGTLIEQKILDWTLEKLGLGKEADGIFTSGGTQSNLMAMLLARDWFCHQRNPEHKNQLHGLPADFHKLRIFTSSVSHFSTQKAAAILGLGYHSVISVPHDHEFCMSPQMLEACIKQCLEEGNIPFAIVATAGTTDFGSIDPLPAIADLAQQYGVWLHVDAAYGGGLLVSSRHTHLLQGIGRADSVTVDYHKSFFQPVSCSAFFIKNKQHFSHLTYHAEYLNPLSAVQEGTPNLVNKSIQTTRRFDALKMWLTLRIMGAKQLGQAFDKVLDTAQTAYRLMKEYACFELVHQPVLSTLVFRFMPMQPLSEDHLDRLNADIRKALLREGNCIIAGTKIEGRQYLKFTFLNPATTQQHLQEIVNEIVAQGNLLLTDIVFSSSEFVGKQ
ncbi:putative L-2,4-diaminobutyrate decarboxylase [Xenorhabdus doucetiae]|uniref:L-2,4-diaminobutyrate decarboxylase n=2 Tax=Xenorhabdus doucetiae TaxID=351671 RepID=A0A068QPH6_9GAMM|nr:aspartate aminotransferase family protein [Xenorhabdus doucetiae]TYP02173.1 L-2,4-diaminobutyrate decarboxylase [Xenorhabdus doucetiae]CDG16942.1 putative L-2,4-diaminobutyrate decarboxylase [Xenorhabdus doucetiae]